VGFDDGVDLGEGEAVSGKEGKDKVVFLGGVEV